MIAQSIIKFKWWIITVVGILICWSIWLIPQLTTDVNFSNFFPKEDKEIQAYEHFVEKLGSNDHFIAVAIIPERHIFDSIFLNRVEQFRRNCVQLQNIESVNAITNISKYAKSPFGLVSIPYIHLNQANKLKQDSSVIFSDFEFTQQYISYDASSLLVILKLTENLSIEANDSIVSELEKLVESYAFHETHTMGKKVIEVYYKRLMNSELSSSILLSFGLIIFLLLLFYRSLKEMILPLLTMIIALLLFYGFLSITGRSLGIMSSLYPTIILIVGISDSIHILTKYNFEINNGSSKIFAIKKVINEVGLSVLLTSITTVFGFLTLTTSVMPALQDFGIDASIGIVLAFIISILLLPAILLVLPLKNTQKKQVKWLD